MNQKQEPKAQAKLNHDNPKQYRHFVEMARDVGAEPDQATLDRILGKVAPSPKPSEAKAASKSARSRKR